MGLSLASVPGLCLAGREEATSQARMAAKVNPLYTKGFSSCAEEKDRGECLPFRRSQLLWFYNECKCFFLYLRLSFKQTLLSQNGIKCIQCIFFLSVMCFLELSHGLPIELQKSLCLKFLQLCPWISPQAQQYACLSCCHVPNVRNRKREREQSKYRFK